ncbi:hypothetical protein FB451DRAFT_736948 [Mycena latifolia]|nr:hypothetical protein FB451DRAFT_736948 [Mycena latifolia]
MTSAIAVFGLQELCDQITHYVALQSSPYDDLGSTALVCQTLCISAQSRIFRHIILDPYQLSNGHLHTLDSALSTAACRFRHLSAILTTSPHLKSAIRRLSVLAQPEILKLVSQIRLPLLCEICLNFNARSPDADILRLTRDWIASPSLREVELVNLEAEWLRLGYLDSVFETCTRHLESLSFRSIGVLLKPTPSPSASCVSRLREAPREQRAQIKSLRLVCADGLADWLMSPSCPLDFTHLVEVETDAWIDSPLRQVLTSARSSIARLRMSGGLAFQLNFSEFPALKCLEVRHLTRSAISSLKPDNRLERLVLHISGLAFDGRSALARTSCAATDSVVAKSPLPSLRQVEVLIGGDLELDLHSVKSYFPQLAARDLLVVRDDRHHNSWI